MLLVVNQDLSAFEKVDESTFLKLNIWERQHIQEWIGLSPEVSSMTIESLLPYYMKYRKKYLEVENPTPESSRTNIEEFVNDAHET